MNLRGGMRAFQVLGVVALAAALIPLDRLLALPPFVERLTVGNPSRYDLTIYVTDEDRDGWLGIGTARPAAESTFKEIIDQGDVWIFRFRSQGESGGELRLTRQQLEEVGWRLRIPHAVGDELRANGAGFPP